MLHVNILLTSAKQKCRLQLRPMRILVWQVFDQKTKLWVHERHVVLDEMAQDRIAPKLEQITWMCTQCLVNPCNNWHLTQNQGETQDGAGRRVRGSSKTFGIHPRRAVNALCQIVVPDVSPNKLNTLDLADLITNKDLTSGCHECQQMSWQSIEKMSVSTLVCLKNKIDWNSLKPLIDLVTVSLKSVRRELFKHRSTRTCWKQCWEDYLFLCNLRSQIQKKNPLWPILTFCCWNWFKYILWFGGKPKLQASSHISCCN